MPYVLSGRLCAYVCDDCEYPLRAAEVVGYQPDRQTNHVAAAAAKPADTFAIVGEDVADDRTILGRATTDDGGGFTLELDEKSYDGGAVELVVTVTTVDGMEPARGRGPVTFTLTTLQPRWREREDVRRAHWEHCLSAKYWCALLGRLGVWTICGRLTACESGMPLGGAVVSAFDTDWLQDDPLGSATTGADGRFRIVYRTSDFERTPLSPLINVELTRGPDLYFTATLGGTTILAEPPSEGRRRGRENVGPCFCVELCGDAPAHGPEASPHWTRVEAFPVSPPASLPGAVFSVEGYAGDPADAFVFGGGVGLYGNCPLLDVVTGDPLEYRFMVGPWTWPAGEDPATLPSVPPTDFVPVVAAGTWVGDVFYVDGNGDERWHPVHISGTGDDGWFRLDGRSVTVPMFNPPGATSVVTVSGSTFLRSGLLLTMDSTVVTGVNPPKLPAGLPQAEAGRALTAAEREPVRRYALRYEVRRAGSAATVYSYTLSSIVLDNSPVVTALNLQELMTNACHPLAGLDEIHLRYTVDHPHLRAFTVSISNNTGGVHPPPAHSGSPTVAMPSGSFTPGGYLFRGGESGPSGGGSGGVAVDVSGDPACAYAVTLWWRTRRWGDWSGTSRQILYCGGKRP